jgi:hypothetical protein
LTRKQAEKLSRRGAMITNIIVKNREDQNKWDLLGSVGRELSKEIKLRNFRNEESLEVCFDSICLDIATRLGAVFESTTDGLLFDFTGMSLTGRRQNNDPHIQSMPGSIADTVDKAFFR